MPARIKPEPGTNGNGNGKTRNGTPPRAVNSSRAPVTTRGETPRTQGHKRMPARPAPSAASSSALTTDDARGHRSNAPTVDTRAVGPGHRSNGHSVMSEGDDDDLVFMEVRPAPVKTEAGMGMDGAIPFAVEAADIDKNLKDIGQHLKKFNDTLGSLQQLGIHHDEPLPELILVGDQSSGKSSLMSAISQIILPRSDGVCTRCPIHIRLSSDTAWRCRVSLQQDYAYRPPNDEPITEDDVTQQNPFPPWVKQQRVVQEFKMVYKKGDPIDEIVRWAQIAILNHNRNYKNYVPKDWDQRTPQEREPGYETERLLDAELHTEAKFSPNIVAIEVRGPDLPDLSFYDMPGVFQNAKHEEDQFLVKVVENLVRSYVSHEKAIILWAVPMNHDPETSSTFTLIRKLKAQNRTIGVMTKADLLPKGGHPQWLEMLAGRQHQVGSGYFITCRAPPVANGDEVQRRDRQSLLDESAAEEAFFNGRSEGAWPQEFEDFHDRCGMSQLVQFLSQRLAQEFARNLPQLSRKLRTKLSKICNDLQRLPEMPQNPEYEVRKSLLKFTTDVQSRLKSKAFLANWAKVAAHFKTLVLQQKPLYIVKPEGFKMDPRDPNSAASDRESVFSANNSPSLSVKRQRPIDLTTDGPPSAQRRRIKVEAEGSFSASPFAMPTTPGGTGGRATSRSLEAIRNLIHNEREAGKPGEVPYDVIEYLCKEAVKPWSTPLHTFLRETMSTLRRELDDSLKDSFRELAKRQVFTQAKHLTHEFLKEHELSVREQLERIYEMETRKAFTMDEDTFRRHRTHEAHMLRRNRHFLRFKHAMNDTSYARLPDWDKMTTEDRKKEEALAQKQAAQLGDDPFEAELNVASHVRGYYLTAAMRFIDIVAMHIDSGLFPDLQAHIEHYLERRMGLDQIGIGAEVFVNLMEEEQSTAEKRVRLKSEQQRFEMAVREIHELNETVTRESTNSGSAVDGGMDEDDGMDAEGEVEMEDESI